MVFFYRINNLMVNTVFYASIVYGTYTAYHASKYTSTVEQHILKSILGGLYGAGWGVICGFAWPVTIGVIATRYFDDDYTI